MKMFFFFACFQTKSVIIKMLQIILDKNISGVYTGLHAHVYDTVKEKDHLIT